MLLTGRTIVMLMTLAIASGGAVWGVHSIISPTGTGSDYGLDTNGNGKFDFLVVEAQVSLPEAGTWDVYADLSSKSPPATGACGFIGRGPPVPILEASDVFGPIAWTYERYFFPSGPQTVRMAFPGTDIARSGVDGPYTVHARLSLGGIVYGGPPMGRPEPVDGVIEWTHVTRAYSVGGFEAPVRPAYFTGGHADSLIDIDADGLADFLELRADVRVSVAGHYSLNGVLSAATGTDATRMVAYAYRDFDLTTSDAEVFLRFRGDQIRQANVDGPWNFTLTLYGAMPVLYGNATFAIGDIRAPIPFPYPETLCGATSAYRASEFDDTVELLRYTMRFAEATPDGNGDGTYDALVVRAEVEVFVSAAFDLSGVLRSPPTSTEVAGAVGQAWLREGIQSVDFVFPGPEIRRSGVDGPYAATLSITPTFRGIDPTTTYTTRPYRAADFDNRSTNSSRGYWIGDLSAAPRGSSLAIALSVVRGNDLLTVVIEDTLTVTIVDAAGAVVGTFKDRVYLPAGGSSQSFAHALDGIAPGTYTVTVVLGPSDQPVDVRTVTVSA